MRLLFAFLLLLSFAVPAYALIASDAVISNQTTATLVVDRDSISARQPFWIALHLQLKEGWHTYWKNSGDSGIPTGIRLTLPEGFKAGEIEWPAPERLVLSGIVNYGYSRDAWHFIRITPGDTLNAPTYPLSAKAEWLACADICIPEHANLSLELPVSSTPGNIDPAFHEALATLPVSLNTSATYTATKESFILTIPDAHLSTSLSFFPFENGIISNETSPAIVKDAKGVTLRFARGESPVKESFGGILKDTESGKAYKLAAIQGSSLPASSFSSTKVPDVENPLSLEAALLLAFGGGLLLNLMPCVLPILSLKALSLIRTADQTQRHMFTHGLAYTAGVMLSFASFAVTLIFLQQAGTHVGWGFQLQSPAFVTFLSLLMFLVGLNLSGMFEFPVLLGNAGQSLSASPTASGSFITGILAVMVATPCTAPFMASALGFALSASPALLFAVFMMLGFGLALPFLLLTAFPAYGRLLPKPGVWMLHLKQFLAFPMYGTAAWLAWVLTRQAGADALAILLSASVFAALLLWSAAIARTRFKRLVMGALLIALIYHSLHLVAGLGTGESVHAYAERYSEEKLNRLTAQGKPVFLYATADWCITCKINEKLVLNTDEVKSYLHMQGITVMEADWTNRDPAITALLQAHGRAGVPMYLYYASHKAPVILPQILTRELVKNATR